MKRTIFDWRWMAIFCTFALTVSACDLVRVPVGGNGCYGNGTCSTNSNGNGIVGACRDGCNRAHMGYDFGGNQGAPIVSVADGKVTRVVTSWSGTGAGKYVEIDHKNGYFSRYLHLHTVDVAVGAEVNELQQIGTMGDTGAGSVHLHWELYDAHSSRHPAGRLRSESWGGTLSGNTYTRTFNTFNGGTVQARALNLNDVIPAGKTLTAGGYVFNHEQAYFDTFTPSIEHSPTGWIDSIGTNGVASGWACDRDDGSSISVHMYAGGQAGSGTWVGAVTANRNSEPAVNGQCGGGSKHRFQFSIPAQHKGKQIYFYGIDANPGDGGGNRVLKGAPKLYP